MGKEEKIKTALIQSITDYVRLNHAGAIDKAYEYFWDEHEPDEFLSGTALTLGFINFEDWLLFDYKVNSDNDTFIDVYARNCSELKEDEKDLLCRIKDSRLSLYEVSSVSREKRILLKDLLMGGEFELKEKVLTKGLKKGDLFATRLLTLDGKSVMSGCVYPFKTEHKKKVLAYIDRQFGRYKRNENPEGNMKGFLKDYGDVFNMAWMNLIIKPPVK